MAGFSEEDIRRVREANDLVDLFSERTQMRQRGRDFWCCCPFHQEKTPSCKVDPVTQTWHCFGCGEGGDAITYIRKLDDVDFVDAVRFLARRANIELKESPQERLGKSKKARVKAVCKETADFYHGLLLRSAESGASQAREYLAGRNLGGDIPRKWMLGFAPGRRQLVTHLRSLGFSDKEMIDANVALQGRDGRGINDRFFERVMFPINDVRGEVIAFGGRVIGTGEPKYLNSGDTPVFHKSEVLFALDKAKASMASTGDAIICEGYTDVIAMHEAGFTNTVATLGTSLTRQHIRLLSHHAKKRIIYLFDGDEAGQRAADRALSFIDASVTPESGSSKVDLFAVTLPNNQDPAEFLASEGQEALLAILYEAIPLIKYGIERRLAKYDLDTPEGRSRATVDALSVLAPIKDSLLAKDYAVYIASRVRAREEDLLERLSMLKAPTQADQDIRNTAKTPQSRGRGLDDYPPAERNRIKAEREFLSLCAQNTGLVPEFYATLGQTQWSMAAHGELANAILDIVAANEAVTPAELIHLAQARNKYATRILTGAVTMGRANPHESLSFLAEELAIGDLERTISEMREGLKSAKEVDPGVTREYFDSIFALQQELNALRAQHAKHD